MNRLQYPTRLAQALLPRTHDTVAVAAVKSARVGEDWWVWVVGGLGLETRAELRNVEVGGQWVVGISPGGEKSCEGWVWAPGMGLGEFRLDFWLGCLPERMPCGMGELWRGGGVFGPW